MKDGSGRSAEILSRERLHEGFVRLERLRLRVTSPAGTAELEREVHAHGHAAALLPVDPVRRVAVLVRQFRAGPFLAGEPAWPLEIPAGLIEAGEDPARTAARETIEETGLWVEAPRPLGPFWPSPGSLSERVELFWALCRVDPAGRSAAGADADEATEIVEMDLGALHRACVTGDIADGKTGLAVLRLAALRPELFHPDGARSGPE